MFRLLIIYILLTRKHYVKIHAITTTKTTTTHETKPRRKMLKMINNSSNFDSPNNLQKNLARLDYKKPMASSRISSSSKNSSNTTTSDYDKRLANLEFNNNKAPKYVNPGGKPLNYTNETLNRHLYANGIHNTVKPSIYSNSTSKYQHVDDHFSGSDMDTLRHLEPSSFSKSHFNENRHG